VDHLCDTDGCVTPEHAVPADAHKTNTDRINCQGVGLHSVGDVITGVVPCQHALKDEDGSVDVMSGCRRLYVLPAPEVYDVKPEFKDDLDNALSRVLDVKVKRRKL